MPQISIIVPVYKVEQYLSACVDSILVQTFEDFELILVDDGSPDNCGVICDLYTEKDQRVKVIHQENQGLSGARNSGMDIALGKYITFIDSDDVVTEDYLNKLLYVLKKENADISICRTHEFEDGVNLELNSDGALGDIQYECFDNKTACIKLYDGSCEVPVNAWGKLFRTELIKSFRFPIGRLHEDQAFVPIVCYNARKVASINVEMYYYRARLESITKSKFSIKRYDDLWAIESCIQFFESKHEKSILESAKKKRQRLICVYYIYAKKDGVIVPKEYRINILKALIYLRKNVSDDKYEYYLGQVNMNLVRWHAYLKKVKEILKKTTMRTNNES